MTARSLAAGVFYGETRSLARCGAILSEVVHERGRICDEHVHEAAYVSLLLEGRYRETSAATTIEYGPFTTAYHPPRTSHSDEMGDGTRLFMIEFGPAWVETIAGAGDATVELHQLHGEEPVWLAVRLHREYLLGASASDAAVESLLYDLCGSIAGDAARTLEVKEPPWLRGVEDAVAAAPERTFDLRALAADAGVHPTHLARAFRRLRGRTLGDHVTALRVQQACRALVETDAPLAAIAADSGFVDQSHFTRTFRTVLGTTPGRYRRAKGER